MREFGTNKTFAVATGKSEGRISQIVKGPETPDRETLSWLLAAFQSFALQEQIRRAWFRDCSPVQDFESLAAEDGALLTQIAELAEELPTRAVDLALARRSVVHDQELWQTLSEQTAHLLLRLSRPGAAAQIIHEMERSARERDDRVDHLTALWMKANALRNLESATSKTVMGAHLAAVSFATNYSPSSPAERERWKDRRSQMDRDFALNVLRAHERHPQPSDLLEQARQSVQRSIDIGASPGFYYMGMEVRARVEITMGDVFRAEQTLEEIEEQGLKDGMEIVEKSALTRAKLCLASNETEEALERLRGISDYCFERMNLHHHRAADQLILRATEGL
ncbi:MAG: hypothetical protein JST30_09755 [Armatimonadetes bacterium]|nr:hypothetical protein [Armatimonadota bacterium]